MLEKNDETILSLIETRRTNRRIRRSGKDVRRRLIVEIDLRNRSIRHEQKAFFSGTKFFRIPLDEHRKNNEDEDDRHR